MAGATPSIYWTFIKIKTEGKKRLVMQDEIKDFLESITAHNTRKGYLRAFELFEEFSGRTISETLKIERKAFKVQIRRSHVDR